MLKTYREKKPDNTGFIEHKYDTDWIKDYCIVCTHSISWDEKRYRASGNFCRRCLDKVNYAIKKKGGSKSND